MTTDLSPRTPESQKVDPVFLQRWSPRSFSNEAVSDDDLQVIFEAARWSPSWLNNQPWRFLYETDGPDREKFDSILMDLNRRWAQDAPVIGLVLADANLEGFFGRTTQFDTGAAAMAMAIQATKLGLSMHLMGGIEVEKAYELTGVDPAKTETLAAFVIGHRGPKDALPEDLVDREVPSERKPLSEVAFKGISAC